MTSSDDSYELPILWVILQKSNYGLSHSDFFATAADVAVGLTHTVDGVQTAAVVGTEKDGGAQKFVNAVLGLSLQGLTLLVLQQSSGLSSMTVTRGDLSLLQILPLLTTARVVINTYSAEAIQCYTLNTSSLELLILLDVHS